MVERSIILTIQTYLEALVAHGIPIAYGVLFGSYARNTGLHQWSDIDVLVVSSRYDESYSRSDITLLWKIAARTDSRIEPIPVGIHRWHTDDGSTILEIARREGVVIPLLPAVGEKGCGEAAAVPPCPGMGEGTAHQVGAGGRE
jgi:predicted nucleotidyltransferase